MTICLFIVLMLREGKKTEAGGGTTASSLIKEVVTESSQILHIKSSLKWLKMYECMMFMNTFVEKYIRVWVHCTTLTWIIFLNAAWLYYFLKF